MKARNPDSDSINFYNDDGSISESYPDIDALLQALMRHESKDAIDITPKLRRTNLLLPKNNSALKE